MALLLLDVAWYNLSPVDNISKCAKASRKRSGVEWMNEKNKNIEEEKSKLEIKKENVFCSAECAKSEEKYSII